MPRLLRMHDNKNQISQPVSSAAYVWFVVVPQIYAHSPLTRQTTRHKQRPNHWPDSCPICYRNDYARGSCSRFFAECQPAAHENPSPDLINALSRVRYRCCLTRQTQSEASMRDPHSTARHKLDHQNRNNVVAIFGRGREIDGEKEREGDT